MSDILLPSSIPSLSDLDLEVGAAVPQPDWLISGSKATEFEKMVSDTVGCKHAIALNSATTGMRLAMQAMGIGRGDRVVTPSLTWQSTVRLVRDQGATPVFCDVDRDTLMITAESIRSSPGSDQARYIIPVHYAGAAAELDPIYRLAGSNDFRIIEDAAQALGTGYHGRPIGALGTAIFSFHTIKDISKGEVGVLCTDDGELAQRICRLKFIEPGAEISYRQLQGRFPQTDTPGPSVRHNLPDRYAALGIQRLHWHDQLKRRRRVLAQWYLHLLAQVDEILPLRQPSTTSMHAWHLFVVRLDIDRTVISRDAFISELRNHGINTGLHFRAQHTQIINQERFEKPVHLPNTKWNSERILCLPLYPDMRNEDVAKVIDTIKKVLHKNRCQVAVPKDRSVGDKQSSGVLSQPVERRKGSLKFTTCSD